jgi:hypothetical protein
MRVSATEPVAPRGAANVCAAGLDHGGPLIAVKVSRTQALCGRERYGGRILEVFPSREAGLRGGGGCGRSLHLFCGGCRAAIRGRRLVGKVEAGCSWLLIDSKRRDQFFCERCRRPPFASPFTSCLHLGFWTSLEVEAWDAGFDVDEAVHGHD